MVVYGLFVLGLIAWVLWFDVYVYVVFVYALVFCVVRCCWLCMLLGFWLGGFWDWYLVYLCVATVDIVGLL